MHCIVFVSYLSFSLGFHGFALAGKATASDSAPMLFQALGAHTQDRQCLGLGLGSREAGGAGGGHWQGSWRGGGAGQAPTPQAGSASRGRGPQCCPELGTDLSRGPRLLSLVVQKYRGLRPGLAPG